LVPPPSGALSFDCIDANKDGVIDREEFAAAMAGTTTRREEFSGRLMQSGSRPASLGGSASGVESDKDFLQFLDKFQSETDSLIGKHLPGHPH